MAGASVVVLLWSVSGCATPARQVAPAATGPVAVAAPPGVGAADRRACVRLIAALPASLGPDITRRPVTGDPQLTAAWGDPAITLRCGVPAPDQGAPPFTIDDLAWVVTETGPAHLWTTRDTRVALAVSINNAYPAQAEVIVRLAAPVLGALPLRSAAG